VTDTGTDAPPGPGSPPPAAPPLTRARGRRQPLAPTAPAVPGGATRLPGGRERRPALAALAVLLVVGGALASALLVLRSGDRTPVLVLTRDIPVGSRLTTGDLTSRDVAADGVATVPAADRDRVVGLVAGTGLVSGSLLSPRELVATTVPGPGRVTIAVPVGRGLVPAQLDAGEHVRVLARGGVPGLNAPGDVVVPDAPVYAVRGDDSGGGFVITLVVADAEAAALVRNTAGDTGGVVLVELPAAGAATRAGG